MWPIFLPPHSLFRLDKVQMHQHSTISSPPDYIRLCQLPFLQTMFSSIFYLYLIQFVKKKFTVLLLFTNLLLLTGSHSKIWPLVLPHLKTGFLEDTNQAFSNSIWNCVPCAISLNHTAVSISVLTSVFLSWSYNFSKTETRWNKHYNGPPWNIL